VWSPCPSALADFYDAQLVFLFSYLFLDFRIIVITFLSSLPFSSLRFRQSECDGLPLRYLFSPRPDLLLMSQFELPLIPEGGGGVSASVNVYLGGPIFVKSGRDTVSEQEYEAYLLYSNYIRETVLVALGRLAASASSRTFTN
jgi:hypothetical protein